jgi:putative ABC transport system permease protein
VAQRTAEFGIRVALGATPLSILALVIRQGMGPVLTGTLVGVAVAIPATGFLEHLLFKTGRLDLLTLAVVFGVLTSSALVACYLPAQRATRVDPLQTLRAE